ncbi:MAG: crossover junction endodeoxyribonuclease RuvC [Candidatus Omnitrophica bacterium]|nr:crossover junction endodeoxyribonuclease RuvC [Candidatus Omnitrophota bacterium]
MLIIGIDPGSNVAGYALLDHTGQKSVLLEAGTIEPSKSARFEIRIEKVYNVLCAILDEYKPDVMVLEKLYTHSQYPTTAGVMGHVRGVICLAAVQKKIELVEYSVKRIRKAVAGNGNATKIQTRKVVAHILKVKEEQMKLDASDAVALALGYVSMERKP